MEFNFRERGLSRILSFVVVGGGGAKRASLGHQLLLSLFIRAAA